MVVEVEAVLNNHPLTYCSPDIKDMDPITPTHLLHGRSTISLPYQDVQDDEVDDPTYGDKSDNTDRELRSKHCCSNISGLDGRRSISLTL